ncbi:MAG: hypothetical protein NTZ90_16965 [Proteobacteria bacterium]|nr:hypothetical protein [Pseudomonadota bacterium]
MSIRDTFVAESRSVFTQVTRVATYGVLALSLACSPSMGSKIASSGSADASASFKSGNTVWTTPVKSQGTIGFCWSYSTMALFENLHRLRTGADLALSPEALGFYHYIDILKGQIANDMDDHAIYDMAEHLDAGDVDGSLFSDTEFAGPLTLLSRHGVMPEVAFPVKFSSNDRAVQFAPRSSKSPKPDSSGYTPEALFHHELADNLRYLLETKGLDYLKGLSEPDIINELMISRYNVNFLHAPPSSFDYEGRTYTAQSFLTDYLMIDVNALTVKMFKSDGALPSNVTGADLPTFYSDVNANLQAGIAVPVALAVVVNRWYKGEIATNPINQDQVAKEQKELNDAQAKVSAYLQTHNGVEPSSDTQDPTDIDYLQSKYLINEYSSPNSFKRAGAHAMTVIGPIKQQVTQGADADKLILKNSWGVAGSVANSPDGLWTIEQGYIKKSAETMFLQYVVPRTPGVAPFLPAANYHR